MWIILFAYTMPVVFSITMTVATTASKPISRYNCFVPLSTFFIALPVVLLAIVPREVGYRFATRIRVRKIATTAAISPPVAPQISPRRNFMICIFFGLSLLWVCHVLQTRS